MLYIREPSLGGIGRGYVIPIQLIIMHYLCVKRYLLRRTSYISYIVAHIRGKLVSISFGLIQSLSVHHKLYIQGEYNIDSMKQKKVKVPYEGYKLPPSAEQGGQFVDFKKIMERKPVKVVKRRVKKNAM